MQDLILRIRADMATADRLHTVLRRYPDHFDDLFCRLVERGENAGALDKTLEYIADYQEDRKKQQPVNA